jgi:hypothetical protein
MKHSEIVYAVWTEKDGIKRPKYNPGLKSRINAQSLIDEWNKEEAELAEMEMRPVRVRYFLVKETTEYEEV